MTDESVLVARAARGEHEAFATLVEVHRPTVVRLATHLLNDSATAEDVAQDAFLRLQAALPGFRGDAALGTWLYRVTLNICRDHMRRARREKVIDTIEARGASTLSVDTHPEHELDVERAKRAIRMAIDRLPKEQKEVVMLRYIEELSYEDIARITETPLGTVASRVFRALERLGRDLEPRHLEVVK